jgi:predicted methyltransferase
MTWFLLAYGAMWLASITGLSTTNLARSKTCSLFKDGKSSELIFLSDIANDNPDWFTWMGCLDNHLSSQLLTYQKEFEDNTGTVVKKKKGKKKNKHKKGDDAEDSSTKSGADVWLQVEESINLGKSRDKLFIGTEGLHDNNKVLLATFDELQQIEKKGGCHAVYNDGTAAWRINTLSGNTNNPASLCPPLESTGPPTMVLGGFTMHRIKGENMNPQVDTKAKIRGSRLFTSATVLDTCCGLGYTAIEAAAKAKEGLVVTIEYDDASVEMCAHNPYSQALFTSENGHNNLVGLKGDSCQVIKHMHDNVFDVIIHDPPARALCATSDMYGLNFYKDLYRVLKEGTGHLFHYIGSPNSKESGRLYGGIKQRLQEAGFTNVQKYEDAFGLIATKR